MLSIKYLYRNLVRSGRPTDQVLLQQPQLETLAPNPSTGLAPLTQVRRSLITVYQSGRTASKMIDQVTRAVYKEWRYRALEYPKLEAPLQAACSLIASGVNSTDLKEMLAVNSMIKTVHGLMVAMGFYPETAYHLIAILVVIEANPQQATAPVSLPKSLGARNPLFPKEKEMKPYRIHIADEVVLCSRFMQSNNDIRIRMQNEWNLFQARNTDSASLLERHLSKHKANRSMLKTTLESVIDRSDLADLLPAYRPYILAVVLEGNFGSQQQQQQQQQNQSVTVTAAMETTTATAAGENRMKIDGNLPFAMPGSFLLTTAKSNGLHQPGRI